jgi:O6-methylguanine-DNA--protein-cysteine methyltransferase
MIYTTHYSSPIGKLLLAEKDDALVGLWIEGQKYYLGTVREEIKEVGDSAVLAQARRWLDRYFAGERPSVMELNIAPDGSPFRKAVWQILCEIPYGRTITYGEIAKKLVQNNGFSKMSAQAWRSGRAQSCFYYNTMSSCSRFKRQPDRLCRRRGNKTKATCIRGCGYDGFVYT